MKIHETLMDWSVRIIIIAVMVLLAFVSYQLWQGDFGTRIIAGTIDFWLTVLILKKLDL